MANDKYPHCNSICHPHLWLRDMKLAMMVDFHREELPDAAKMGFTTKVHEGIERVTKMSTARAKREQ